MFFGYVDFPETRRVFFPPGLVFPPGGKTRSCIGSFCPGTVTFDDDGTWIITEECIISDVQFAIEGCANTEEVQQNKGIYFITVFASLIIFTFTEM